MLRFTAENQQTKTRMGLEKLLEGMSPGSKLPSEPTLAKKLGVSRTTIRAVMGQLEMEGFVIRRQGSGTFVSQPPLEPDENLQHFMDFPTLIIKQGYRPTFRQLGFVQQTAGALFSSSLQVSKEDKIITRRCLYLADGQFCVLVEDSFPAELITRSQYNRLLQTENIDLRLFLFRITGRTAYRDEATISVMPSSGYPFLKTILGENEVPLLFIESLCLDKQNRPFTCSQIYSDTKFIRYKLNRNML